MKLDRLLDYPRPEKVNPEVTLKGVLKPPTVLCISGSMAKALAENNVTRVAGIIGCMVPFRTVE